MHKYNDPKFFWSYRVMDWLSWGAVVFAILYFLQAALEMRGICVLRDRSTTTVQLPIVR